MHKRAQAVAVGVVLFSIAIAASPASASASVPSACVGGLKKFRFLKSWAEKLDNFSVPVVTGTMNSSEVFVAGATLASENAFDVYRGQNISPWNPRAGTLRARTVGLLLNPLEKKLLGACAKFPCAIKFKKSEFDEVVKYADVARQNRFLEILSRRLAQYEKNAEVLGYEDEKQPSWLDRSWPSELPIELGTGFLKTKERSLFGVESYDPEPGKHKPVTGVFSRSCEERGELENKYQVCTEVVVYSNHYFDFWARSFFFFPWCGKTFVLGYETADVDQIKSSKMVGIIFGSEIRRRFAAMLESRLKQISVIPLNP